MKLRHALEKFFSQARVQRQLISVFILSLLIPITCIGFLLLHNLTNTVFDHYRQQAESDALRIRSIMFEVTTNFYNISSDIIADEQLLSLLETKWLSGGAARSAADAYGQLSNIRQKDTSVAFIRIYTYNTALADCEDFFLITDEIMQQEWFAQASYTPAVFWHTQLRTDRYGNDYRELNLFRQITLPQTRSYAILQMTVSDNYLKNRIDNNAMEALITVNQEDVFFSTRKAYLGRPLPLEVDYTKYANRESGALLLGRDKTMGAVNTLRPYKSDDCLYIVSYNPQALGELKKIQINYCLILLFAIALPCLLIYLFVRYFSARVNTLRSAMHQASRGDYNIIDSFHGNDELSEAFGDLQTMIEEIKEKEALVYEARLKEQTLENRQQQMEYKVLASQINPHFLYNTLETIRMKALAAGNRDVAMAIKLLGKSLRYVLDNTGTVSTTLARELDYIQTYCTIQRLRFGERVNYRVDVQEGLDLNNYQILPLLLQPIVENAISHGLEDVEENGEILLHVYEKDDLLLCIDISDNGIGMTLQQLAQLRKNISEKDTSRTQSIGLYNINQRLQLFYGPEHSLQIDSLLGHGTTVSLRLPLNKLFE